MNMNNTKQIVMYNGLYTLREQEPMVGLFLQQNLLILSHIVVLLRVWLRESSDIHKQIYIVYMNNQFNINRDLKCQSKVE